MGGTGIPCTQVYTFFKYICTGTTGAQVGCRINRTCSTVSGTTGRCVQVVGVYYIYMMTCVQCTMYHHNMWPHTYGVQYKVHTSGSR